MFFCLHFGVFIVLLSQVYSRPSNFKCGGLLTDPEGSISTPNYPHKYDYDMECEWTIEAPAGKVVKLTFTDFDVESFDHECDTDKVHIRDGKDDNSPLLGKILCGQTTPEEITSTGRYLTINFKSDFISTGGRGFDAEYITIPANEGRSCVTNACGGTIRSTTCQIQSPGFPSSFDSALNCSWLIKAPHPSHKISFRFIDLNLNAPNSLCKNNNVTIYDGINILAPIIHESLCDIDHNRLNERRLISKGPTVVMRFRTSESLTRQGEINGFNLKFEVLDIDGNIVVPTSSPVVTSTLASSASTTTKATTTTQSSTKSTTTVKPTTTTTLSTTTSTIKAKDADKSQAETTTPKEDTTKTLKASPISNPATMSGIVIGIIVVIAVVVLAVLLLMAFKQWKKRNVRFSQGFREDDARSDVNTLLSSNDSREFNDLKKNGGSIVRQSEEVL